MTHRTGSLASALALIALGSCGASNRGNNQANAETTVENPIRARLSVTSDAFQNGQPIPARYTCDGEDQAPTIHWSEPPDDTRSFALIIDDPDAPGGIFRHWGIFDIPASIRSLGGQQKIGTEARNDFGKPGYGGPCPPPGHGVHHYHIRLFALDRERLGLSGDAKILDVENAALKHSIAQGEIVGTYERK